MSMLHRSPGEGAPGCTHLLITLTQPDLWDVVVLRRGTDDRITAADLLLRVGHSSACNHHTWGLGDRHRRRPAAQSALQFLRPNRCRGDVAAQSGRHGAHVRVESAGVARILRPENLFANGRLLEWQGCVLRHWSPLLCTARHYMAN